MLLAEPLGVNIISSVFALINFATDFLAFEIIFFVFSPSECRLDGFPKISKILMMYSFV